MNSSNDMEKLYKDIYRSMAVIFGDSMERVVLYGSYARGDFDEESDIDIAVIAREDDQDLQKHHKDMVKEVSRFMREYDKLVSIHGIPADRYNRFKEAYPYYRNIEREGRNLYA